MKRFGFDLDGVLYNWHKVAYDYVKQNKGETRTLEKFWQDVIDDNNVEQYSKLFWTNLISLDTLYSKLPAPSRDVETLKELSKDFDIVYITHRPQEVRITTIQWLRRYGFPNPERVTFTKVPKEVAVRLVGCDYYIEDRPEILRGNLKDVTNLIAMRTLWNWDECETLPYVDWIHEIPELLRSM